MSCSFKAHSPADAGFSFVSSIFVPSIKKIIYRLYDQAYQKSA
jgi:hypothetical protein